MVIGYKSRLGVLLWQSASLGEASPLIKGCESRTTSAVASVCYSDEEAIASRLASILSLWWIRTIRKEYSKPTRPTATPISHRSLLRGWESQTVRMYAFRLKKKTPNVTITA